MKNIYKMLNRPELIRAKIVRYQNEIAELRDKLIPGSMDYSAPKVQFSPKDRIPEITGKIYELEKKVKNLKWERSRAIKDIKVEMRILSDVQRTVITLLYIDGMSMKKVARELGYSERQVYNIQHSAIRKMSR